MLDSAELVAFAPSTDLERSRAFYTDVAGLEFIEQTDIREAVAELRGRCVEFLTFDTLPQDTDKIWTTPGGRIAWFTDPDGNVLSLTEFTGD